MEAKPPESFRSLLWSYDFNRIDPLTNRKTIIIQAINYGTLAHWRWLKENCGLDGIHEVLTTVPATQMRPPARKLASLIFGVDRFHYAPRGTH